MKSYEGVFVEFLQGLHEIGADMPLQVTLTHDDFHVFAVNVLIGRDRDGEDIGARAEEFIYRSGFGPVKIRKEPPEITLDPAPPKEEP